MSTYEWLCILAVIIVCHSQELTTAGSSSSDWNGDPTICTRNPSSFTPPTLSKPLPKFPNKAAFIVEQVVTQHLTNGQSSSMSKLSEYRYDYDDNELIIVKNEQGSTSVEYYYYEVLKKSTYYEEKFCLETGIPKKDDFGQFSLYDTSATQLSNGSWHIRPLNEFLVFSSTDTDEGLTPIYLGVETVRGIPVDKWQTCYFNKTQYRTVSRIWTFVQQDFIATSTGHSDYAIPVQVIQNGSVSFLNETRTTQDDVILNFYSYKPDIIERMAQLSPPREIFCSTGSGNNLLSLEDVGIIWPNQFSVRVAALTSRISSWQNIHLRYDQGRNGIVKRLRYDYLPYGVEKYRTVIHNYFDNLTYTIDRSTGFCQIDRGMVIPATNPTLDPVRFFINNEDKFIFNPPQKAWKFNGLRSCRGSGITCVILTAEISNFPAIVDPDSGIPIGNTWAATNIEYAWSKRTSSEILKYDYPVSLYLRMYRFENPNNPSPFSLITEDIEYEFYEMVADDLVSDFDTSLCYRSLDLPYLHLGFVLKPVNNTLIDTAYLDMLVFERELRFSLVSEAQVNIQRISDVEFDYIQFENSFYVLFTLLGPTPFASTNEPSVDDVQQSLEIQINANLFMFDLTLSDSLKTSIRFMAQAGSLQVFKQFMSIHSSWTYANVSNCSVTSSTSTSTTATDVTSGSHLTTTIPNCQKVNNTQSNRNPIKKEKYSTGALVGSIVGGFIIGTVLGFIVLLLNQFLNKTTSNTSTLISGGLFNRSFHKNKAIPSISMQALQDANNESNDG